LFEEEVIQDEKEEKEAKQEHGWREKNNVQFFFFSCILTPFSFLLDSKEQMDGDV
jgi:hypothetical protein